MALTRTVSASALMAGHAPPGGVLLAGEDHAVCPGCASRRFDAQADAEAIAASSSVPHLKTCSFAPRQTTPASTTTRQQLERKEEAHRRRWRKLRTIIIVIARLKAIADEVRTYGTLGQPAPTPGDLQKAPSRRLRVCWPHSGLRNVWSLCVALTTLAAVLFIPYRVGFELPATGGWLFLRHCVFVVFIVDLIVNVNTAVQGPDGQWVTDRGVILRRYVSSPMFVVDLLAALPGDYIVPSTAATTALARQNVYRGAQCFWRLLRLLPTLRAFHMNEYLTIVNRRLRLTTTVSRFTTVLMLVALVSHMLACLWHYFSQGYHDESWVVRHGVFDKPAWDRYLFSLYWAITTLTTVGYGDITPRTPEELIFNMACMILGVAWYGFVVSTMTQVLRGLDAANEEAMALQTKLSAFFGKAKVSRSLRNRITSYYERHGGVSTLMDPAVQQQVLNTLSPGLRREVVVHKFREVIAATPYLRNRSIELQAAVAPLLRPVFMEQGESVFAEGMAPDAIYFLARGRILLHKNDTSVCVYSRGSYFGEISMIAFAERIMNADAITSCQLYVLHRKDLPGVLRDFPSVRMEMRRTAAQRLAAFQVVCDALPSSPFLDSTGLRSTASAAKLTAGVAFGASTHLSELSPWLTVAESASIIPNLAAHASVQAGAGAGAGAGAATAGSSTTASSSSRTAASASGRTVSTTSEPTSAREARERFVHSLSRVTSGGSSLTTTSPSAWASAMGHDLASSPSPSPAAATATAGPAGPAGAGLGASHVAGAGDGSGVALSTATPTTPTQHASVGSVVQAAHSPPAPPHPQPRHRPKEPATATAEMLQHLLASVQSLERHQRQMQASLRSLESHLSSNNGSARSLDDG